MANPLMDLQALRRDLEAQIEGEVRFDKVSRALYSTDASVYQIEPAGVVVARSRDDIVRAVKICRTHGCPLTMRGGGTSQAGQAIGEGLQVDTSKYFNRLLEVNVGGALGARRAGHRARRAERRASAARPALRAGHLDRQPRHRRRHDGQQLERRALGAVRQDDRSRARAARRAVGRLGRPLPAARARASVDAICAARTRSKRRAIARCGGSAATHADEIDRRYPEGAAPRRRLQPRRLRRSRRAVQPREADGRLGRHARRRPRSEDRAGAAAEGQGGAGDSVRRSARSARGDAGDSRAPAVGGRGDGRLHPRQHEAEPGARSHAPHASSRAIPAALLCVELYDDDASDLPPRLDALERDLAARGLGLPLLPRAGSRRRRRRSGACARRRSACRWR